MTFRRFIRTPKGQLIALLAALVAIATAGTGVGQVGPGVVASLLAALIIDGPALRARTGRWVFPDGAILTALIVAMVMSPYESWYVPATATTVGVLSKYVVRVRTANVFNPAALGLLAAYFVFDAAQSWWGALPELPYAALVLLLGAGGFIAWRVNKLPLVLSFLGGYFLLVTVTAFFGDPASVAELYRSPDLHTALYFAFFMITDPPTSPPRPRDQLVNGALVALVSYLVFELVGAVYFLLAGLLAANVLEAWRRHRRV
ncbi:MAG: RnfABCDGE type electron transport complex subunit D [Gemmatimonadota bacterium]|nr:RnfABCDGE type electron transport complex subunit D [Gemmatimonadota bacterium]